MCADRIPIDNGPDLLKMIISLAEGNPSPRRKVQFVFAVQTRNLEVAITGLEQEDGSGNRWIFKGYGTAGEVRSQVQGYYDSQTRKGWFAWVPSRT